MQDAKQLAPHQVIGLVILSVVFGGAAPLIFLGVEGANGYLLGIVVAAFLFFLFACLTTMAARNSRKES